MAENPPANTGVAGDTGLIPELGRSPGRGNGNPLQYACLGNPMDRGGRWGTVCGVTKSWTRLTEHAYTHTHTHTHTHTCTLRVAKAVGLASLILQASGQLSQGVERKKPDF